MFAKSYFFECVGRFHGTSNCKKLEIDSIHFEIDLQNFHYAFVSCPKESVPILPANWYVMSTSMFTGQNNPFAKNASETFATKSVTFR